MKNLASAYIEYPSRQVSEVLDKISDDDIIAVNNAIAADVEFKNLPETTRQFFEDGRVKPEWRSDLICYMSHRIWKNW